MVLLVILANVGNPALFLLRRDAWKEQHGHIKGAAWDVWLSYFHQISPNWKGHAVETFQQYLRFNLIGMFDQLGNISKDMSSTMHSQYKEVMEYDLAAFGLLIRNKKIFAGLAALAHLPLTKVALYTQSGLFLTAAGNLVKQFYDIYLSYDGTLNDLELKMNDLRGVFYEAGRRALGPRDELHLSPHVGNPAYWTPITEETP
ncbi:hypothetical protein [Nonomuraea sp. bgisy101]